jgi:hypothetical protein
MAAGSDQETGSLLGSLNHVLLWLLTDTNEYSAGPVYTVWGRGVVARVVYWFALWHQNLDSFFF